VSLVLDNSVVLAWNLADEVSPLAEAAKREVKSGGAWVPAIWWYELRNSLVVNERRERLLSTDTYEILHDMGTLDIRVDFAPDSGATIDLARNHDTSVYDAAYLELAKRMQLPLATLDLRLVTAARAASVSLFNS